jgi:hypothetical protein
MTDTVSYIMRRTEPLLYSLVSPIAVWRSALGEKKKEDLVIVEMWAWGRVHLNVISELLHTTLHSRPGKMIPRDSDIATSPTGGGSIYF